MSWLLPDSPRARWWIVALLSASIAINLMDRQVLSVVAPVLREQFRLSNTQYAHIILAFQIGMFLGQVPAGVLMDALGTRLAMALIFAGWSLWNGLHALARGPASFIGLRFLMGLSECGNYTGGIKAIAGLFPAERRSLAGGIFNAGAQLGSVVAPPLIVGITLRWSWQMAFLLPSLLGLVWIVPWLASAPTRGAAFRPLAGFSPRTGLRVLLRNPQVRGLLLLRVFTGPLTSFYWYWLPEYLRHGRGMEFWMIGALAWLPYVFGSLGNMLGGFFSDSLIRRGMGLDRARKLGFECSAALSALSLTLPFIHDNFVALALICAIVFGNNWTAATYIGTVGDIFHESVVGRVNGIAGAGDSAAGMITMPLTGILVDHFSYVPVLIAAGIFPLLGLASILLLVRRIEPVWLKTTD